MLMEFHAFFPKQLLVQTVNFCYGNNKFMEFNIWLGSVLNHTSIKKKQIEIKLLYSNLNYETVML
jgi:hypothetical protein